MKMLKCRRIVFVSLIGFIFPFACVEKKTEEVVSPERPLTDLPVAPAAPVAPEAPASMEVDDNTPKRANPKTKKSVIKPAKKIRDKRVNK
jgi:hypothetical protein